MKVSTNRRNSLVILLKHRFLCWGIFDGAFRDTLDFVRCLFFKSSGDAEVRKEEEKIENRFVSPVYLVLCALR